MNTLLFKLGLRARFPLKRLLKLTASPNQPLKKAQHSLSSWYVIFAVKGQHSLGPCLRKKNKQLNDSLHGFKAIATADKPIVNSLEWRGRKW